MVSPSIGHRSIDFPVLTSNFKQGAQKCRNPTCVSPDIILNWQDIHIDHYENTFDEIKHDFMEMYKGKIPSTFSKGTNSRYMYATTLFKMHIPDDKLFAESWADYHAEHAKLRICCIRCNLSVLTRENNIKKQTDTHIVL